MNFKTVFCFDEEDFQKVKEIELFWQEQLENPLITADDFCNKSLEEIISVLRESKPEETIEKTTGEQATETPITVVFIGKRTFENGKCLAVIKESFKAASAFLAVYLNNAEDVKKSGKELLGKNPFDLFYFEHKAGKTILNTGAVVLPGKLKRRLMTKEIKAKADFVKIYDYIKDCGAENLIAWIEEEQTRKADFWAECNKVSEKEWPTALKIVNQGGIAGMFLYYDWVTYSDDRYSFEQQLLKD